MASKSDTFVKVFIKSSISLKNTDNNAPGPCPKCQEWMMVLHCLSKDFQKFDFCAEIVTEPPNEEWKKIDSTSPPVIKVTKGIAPNDEDLTGLVFDNLEGFLVLWECSGFMPPKKGSPQEAAEKAFLNLYSNFCAYLHDTAKETALLKSLSVLDKYLEQQGTKFLLGDYLSYPDCTLIPKLHHLKIAAEAYKGFTIPLDYIHVWRYLKHAYETSAFDDTQPFDEDIVLLYQYKASCRPKINPFGRDLHQTKTVPKEAHDMD